jgi:hypothetical protein
MAAGTPNSRRLSVRLSNKSPIRVSPSRSHDYEFPNFKDPAKQRRATLTFFRRWATNIGPQTSFIGEIAPFPNNRNWTLSSGILRCYVRYSRNGHERTRCVAVRPSLRYEPDSDGSDGSSNSGGGRGGRGRCQYRLYFRAAGGWLTDLRWLEVEAQVQRRLQNCPMASPSSSPVRRKTPEVLARPSNREFVMVRPPFPFMRLPAELRVKVLRLAIGVRDGAELQLRRANYAEEKDVRFSLEPGSSFAAG